MKNRDLTIIGGVGKETEKRLKDAGFDSIEDIAEACMAEDPLQELSTELNLPTEVTSCIIMFARGYVIAKKEKPPRSSISSRIRFEVLKRDAFRCQYCGKQAGAGAELEIDHIVPTSKGGTSDKENLITACKVCNNGKSSKELFTEPGGAEHR